MSAIVGLYYLDQRPVDSAILSQMVDVLGHRGPDGRDSWCDRNIGFGHCMLWTTPESLHEQLPFTRGELAITADARIDNRSELIAALGLRAYPSEQLSDSQLILAAYEKWQEQCPEKLIGDFAFAIWDGYQQKLFCARDPMGIKPFYYHCSGQLFCFASEIKALLGVPGVPHRLNELKVGCHLALFGEEPIQTFYQGVLKLQAAHCLQIGHTRQLKIERYWSLDPNREICLSSDDEYTDAFLEIFTEAVRCRLRSAFPISSTLSGGLDSSSIACVARKLLAGRQKLHTFSAIFPSLPLEERQWIDERHYMDAVKQLEGIEAHDVRADQLNPLISLLWQDDEPICAPNLYIHQGLYQSAQNQGVRVFLDGIDGDSTLSHGWSYLTELAYTGRWRTLAKLVTASARNHRISRKSIVQQQVFHPLLVEPLATIWQQLCHLANWHFPGDTLVGDRLTLTIGLADYMHALTRNQGSSISPRQQHWAGLSSAFYPNVMEITDKATARFALEGRYPFFDRRLMEFCLALPSNQKFRNGWSRSILRFAMTDILPSKVQWRRGKGQLGANFIRRFLALEKNTLGSMMQSPESIHPYVNKSTLQSAYNNYVVSNTSNGDDAMTLLSAVTLSKWLEQSFSGAV